MHFEVPKNEPILNSEFDISYSARQTLSAQLSS